jgi:hypothetical protein
MPELRPFVLLAAVAADLACSTATTPDFDAGAGTGSSGISPVTGADTTGVQRVDLGGGIATEADAEAGATEGCGNVTATLTQVVPTVWLLLDQSTSMDEDFGDTTRWLAMQETLFDPDQGIVSELQTVVRFGMSLYTSDGGFEGGACPILTEIGPALDNGQAMAATLDGVEPTGDTPTGESLAVVAAELVAYEDGDGPKIIVLATDGEPDTCAAPNPQTGQPESLAACAMAYEQGLSVYVVSVGDEVGVEHLQQMANVGVGKELDDPDPAPYYQALDPEALVAAFDAIIGGIVSCELVIEGIVDPETACDGTVLLDGTPLVCGDDWEFQPPASLVLLGAACEALQDGSPHSVEASWPCDSIMIP